MTDTRVDLDTLPELLTAEEAAEYLGTSENYVRRQCANGNLKGTNLKGKAGWRIHRDAIRTFLGADVPAARPRPPRGRQRAR